MSAASLTTESFVRYVAAQYDYAVHGGAVGDISLRVTVPKGAIIVNAIVEVLTVPTSGGSATIALKLESAGDIVAATSIASAPWSATGIKLGIPDHATVADQFKTTADRTLTATVATAALTAGKFNVFLMYVVNTAQ
jgi:hypothetical protein